MVWVLGILKFICTFIAIMSLGLFTLSCVASIVNPQLTVIDGEVKEKYGNSRLMYLLITAIAWAFVVVL